MSLAPTISWSKTVQPSSADRATVVRHRKEKNRQRSRVANGSELISGVDGRSVWVRRCKELIADHTSDLGGADNMSAAEVSIVRRASVLETELERLEVKFALEVERAAAEDLELYSRAAANLRRLLESVGLKRRPKNVNPTLRDYLQAREFEDGADAIEGEIVRGEEGDR